MRSNIKTRQNSFFKSPLSINKTEYVKFQTSVSLYLDFNGKYCEMERQSNLEFYIICLRSELQRNGLAKLILHEPITET